MKPGRLFFMNSGILIHTTFEKFVPFASVVKIINTPL